MLAIVKVQSNLLYNYKSPLIKAAHSFENVIQKRLGNRYRMYKWDRYQWFPYPRRIWQTRQRRWVRTRPDRSRRRWRSGRDLERKRWAQWSRRYRPSHHFDDYGRRHRLNSIRLRRGRHSCRLLHPVHRDHCHLDFVRALLGNEDDFEMQHYI